MSRFHNFSQRLHATGTELTPDDEPEEDCTTGKGDKSKPKSKKKDSDMSEETSAEALSAAKKEGFDAGFKAAIDRQNTVMASEHYKGREAQAATMLGKQSMSAEDIVDVLASSPKVEQSALTEEQQRAAAEEAGRKEMREQIGQQGNSGVDADAGGKATEPNHGWDAIHSDIRSRRG